MGLLRCPRSTRCCASRAWRFDGGICRHCSSPRTQPRFLHRRYWGRLGLSCAINLGASLSASHSGLLGAGLVIFGGLSTARTDTVLTRNLVSSLLLCRSRAIPICRANSHPSSLRRRRIRRSPFVFGHGFLSSHACSVGEFDLHWAMQPGLGPVFPFFFGGALDRISGRVCRRAGRIFGGTMP